MDLGLTHKSLLIICLLRDACRLFFDFIDLYLIYYFASQSYIILVYMLSPISLKTSILSQVIIIPRDIQTVSTSNYYNPEILQVFIRCMIGVHSAEIRISTFGLATTANSDTVDRLDLLCHK